MLPSRALIRAAKLSLCLSFLLCLGCTSFLADRALKSYPVELTPAETATATNDFQHDFLYLTKFAAEAFPLQDHYFPPDRRTNTERVILTRLGAPDTTYDTFVNSLRTYLAAYNNEHARILYNPKPIQLTGYYPFSVQYQSNDLHLSNISADYPATAIGQKLISINSHPIADIEQKFAAFFSAENIWAKRNLLLHAPNAYVRPHFYTLAGITASETNELTIALENHPPLSIKPLSKPASKWHRERTRNPVTSRSRHSFDHRLFPEQNLAYLQFNTCFDKTAILDGLRMANPWIRPALRAWLAWQFLRDQPAPVLRGIYDPDRPSLKNYLANTFTEINQAGITNLILDLRYNSGGDISLCYQLIYHFADDITDLREFRYNPKLLAHYQSRAAYKKFLTSYREQFKTDPPTGQLFPVAHDHRAGFSTTKDPDSPYFIPPSRPVFKGRVIVLANANTKSAASLLTALLQDNHLAQVVGTTTANNPTGPTGVTTFKLPNTKILISLPGEYLQRADPTKGELLIPNHWSEPALNDPPTGNDTDFNKAVHLLHTK
jgi:hypothetical protein